MAEQESPDEEKRENSTVLWDIVQTFSDEAQATAKKKAIDNGFSLTRGEIPFEESLINLSHSRDLLISSIEDGALPQLPLKIQNQLIADAKRVSAQLTQLLNGADSVVALGSAVDDLTATIWNSNLQNMSGEILGFQKKQNQLKTLERTLRDLAREAEEFKEKEAAAEQALQEIQSRSGQASFAAEAIQRNAEEIANSASFSKEAEQEIAASLALAQEQAKSIAESLASSNASVAELDSQKSTGESIISELETLRGDYATLTQELTEFKAAVLQEIEEHRENQRNEYEALDEKSREQLAKLQESVSDATDTLSKTVKSTLKSAIDEFEANTSTLLSTLEASEEAREQKATSALKKASEDFSKELDELTVRSNTLITEAEQKTKERFEELLALEDVVREKIRLATNYQLFHAFQTRQLAIAEGKNFWRNALFGLVGLSFALAVAFIVYLFIGKPAYDASFYLKLSISFPLVYAIHFCSAEYSKERKLEEEYAFKGNISISLEPYRELVEKMIDKNDTAEAAKYSDFVISSIDKVFTSPTSNVFGSKETRAAADEIADTSKGLTKILGSVNELVESLAKFK